MSSTTRIASKSRRTSSTRSTARSRRRSVHQRDRTGMNSSRRGGGRGGLPNPFIRVSHRVGRTMAEFKAVIADPKSGKTYKRDVAGQFANALVGRKLGEEIDGLFVGLPGYKLVITGGSDKDGVPMRRGAPRPPGA